jgi:hypothetical protein
MHRIKDVIKNTAVPSWLNSVPYNYGEAVAGTVKADEWHNLSTIFLPLALISMWGDGTSHASPEEAAQLRQVLDHTMLLVSAIWLACMHTMTQARSAAYLRCMTEYIKQLTILHPHINCRPNHHMSLHLPHFLRLFGPVRSWWCFPFERLIGQIQRLLSNHKFGSLFFTSICLLLLTSRLPGQMESTLLESFLRAGKLKRWLAKPDCPPVIKECKQLFDKIYAPKVPDSNLSNHSPADESAGNIPVTRTRAIPDDLRRLLIHTQDVVIPARVRHNGIVYSSSQSHLGNSLVHFYPHGNRTPSPIPGSIKYVYRERNVTYLAVQRQLPVDNTFRDPFALYPHFPAKVYSAQLSESLERVELDWIFAHYARWNFSPQYAVILSLSRVRVFYYCGDSGLLSSASRNKCR